MNIALFIAASNNLSEIDTELLNHGVKTHAVPLNSRVDLQMKEGVLVAPNHGAGEPTELARQALGRSGRLIVCTLQPDAEDRKLLFELGASEIITPRSWSPEHVAERILAQLILEGGITPNSSGLLCGATVVMRALYQELAVIAPLPDPVLILGETGTGKELIAGEIHRLSERKDKFVAINCGELSVELAGSDLFGHKKGSFSGSTETRQGLLAEAKHGTVFLDEIGELDLRAQAFLLRVLEEGKVRRVGANLSEDIHARFVLATNRDLEAECEAGRFRPDLFERIRGFTVELPPLRERRADIPLLVQHFVEQFNEESGKALRVPGGSLDRLFDYEWIGNVRELRNTVRKAAAFADQDGFISGLQLIQATLRRSRTRVVNSEAVGHSVAFDPKVDTWKDFLKRAQAAYFQAIIETAGGNKEEARQLSGFSTSQFYEKLKEIESSKK